MDPPEPALNFTCAICQHSFNAKRGLGVHARAAHPEDFHAENLPVASRPRLTKADAYLLASYEASILTSNLRTC